MRPLLRFAVKVYPRQWRARYGAEFHALLDDLQPSWVDVVDVIAGGLKMRLTQSTLVTPIVICATIGVCVGGIFAFLAPPRFASTAMMRVNPTLDAILPGALRVPLTTTDILPKDIKVERVEGMLRVSVFDADAHRAQELARALTNQLARAKDVTLETVEMPNLQNIPVAPNRVAFAGTGLLTGGMFGALIVLLRSRRSSVPA